MHSVWPALQKRFRGKIQERVAHAQTPTGCRWYPPCGVGKLASLGDISLHFVDRALVGNGIAIMKFGRRSKIDSRSMHPTDEMTEELVANVLATHRSIARVTWRSGVLDSGDIRALKKLHS